MTRLDRLIPLNRLPEGLRLVAQNTRDFIVEANSILSKGHGYHALALAIFAFEELGKYAELKRLGDEAVNLGLSQITVKDELFTRHDYKQQIAQKLVSAVCADAMIVLPADFDVRDFNPRDFQTEEVSVTPRLRTDCVFVDWVKGDWRYGSPHDTTRIRTFLDAILVALNSLGA